MILFNYGNSVTNNSSFLIFLFKNYGFHVHNLYIANKYQNRNIKPFIMTKQITFYLLLIICFTITIPAFAQYVTVEFSSGLNEDVIANGVGLATSSTSTDVDGGNYCLIAKDYRETATSPALTYGLPVSGTITSAATATPGLAFQMSPFDTPYAGNNSLRLSSIGDSGTLEFAVPLAAQTLYLLAHSGGGSSYFTATINFEDSTTQAVASTFLPDWFFSTYYPAAIAGIGRIKRSTDDLESSATDPRLYQIAIAILPENQYKLIESITIEKASGSDFGSIANFYAISANASPTCPQPVALSVTAITTNSADLQWSNPGGSDPMFYQVQYGAIGFALGSGTIDTSVDTIHHLASLAVATSYSFYVRAVCSADDTSTWAGPYDFSTLCIVPALLSRKDSSRCGPGIVVLEAAAEAGATVNWYSSIAAATSLHTGGVFTTPALSANTTYYVAAVKAGCESDRLPVKAIIKPVPVVDLGSDTTICPGTVISLDAVNPGNTYLWGGGQTTRTITVSEPGYYTVAVTGTEGCTGHDSIDISPGLVPDDTLPGSFDLCEGGMISLDAGNTGSTFLWNTAATTQIINVSLSGDYKVLVTSIDGCEIEMSTSVIEHPLPVVQLGNDTTICMSETIILDAQNEGAAFLWNTSDTTRTIIVNDSGTYVVGVTTVYGCFNSDGITISYLPEPYTSGFNFVADVFEYGPGAIVRFTPLDTQNVITYHWDFGDGATSSDISPVHEYTATGDYLVTLTVSNDCGNTSVELEISADRATGMIAAKNYGHQLEIYPVPARDYFILKSESVMQAVNVMDINGRVVYKHSGIRNSICSVPVGNFPNGVYTVRATTAQGALVRKIEILH